MEMLDSFCIEGGFGQADLADKGVGLLVEVVDFGGAVDAEVVLAEEHEEVFRPALADRASFLRVHRYLFKLAVYNAGLHYYP